MEATYKVANWCGILVARGAISDPLKSLVWILSASASSRMETRVWKPKPKEWICEQELAVQATLVVPCVDSYHMILQPMVICKQTHCNTES